MLTQEFEGLTGVAPIPAMTTDAERECYYRLVSQSVGKGAIVEFGSWLGASTAYIAAAIRDSGDPSKAHVYDKFQSKKGHARKVQEFYSKEGLPEIPLGDAYNHFLANLGPLAEYVQTHKCQIEEAKWGSDPIALIITDAPKRVNAISKVLTNFRNGIREGTIMAWQDFCHFPSYEIPASLYRLKDNFRFVEAVVPGTTMVFEASPWSKEQVSPEALSLSRWTPDEIDEAWNYWSRYVPDSKASLFDCGKAMFLSDIGYYGEAVQALSGVLERANSDVNKKWAYLKRVRPDFIIRYRYLFECFSEMMGEET